MLISFGGFKDIVLRLSEAVKVPRNADKQRPLRSGGLQDQIATELKAVLAQRREGRSDLWRLLLSFLRFCSACIASTATVWY